MAKLVIDAALVSAVKVTRAYHGVNGESLVKGDYAILDPTTGHFIAGNGATAAGVGAGSQRGIVYEVLVNSVRVMGEGILDLGPEVLDDLDFDDPVYIDDDDKGLGGAAADSTEVAVIGHVVPGWASGATADKLLEVNSG